MRKEIKFGLGGLVIGFFYCFLLSFLFMPVSASEVSESTSTGQDEQTEATRSDGSEAVDEQIAQSEPEPDYYNHGETMGFDVEGDLDINLESLIPEDQMELLSGLAGDLETRDGQASQTNFQIEPFASGVIVGELADLLQENVIENDGYTEESWQRYEEAVASSWVVIGNFMAYTNDEVRAVIDELQAAISGLEYPAGNPPMSASSVDTGILTGLVAVLVFSSGFRCAT